jgi:hypothetical protein
MARDPAGGCCHSHQAHCAQQVFGISRETDGNVRLAYSAPEGSEQVIEGSEDLLQWQALQTNHVASSPALWVDATSTATLQVLPLAVVRPGPVFGRLSWALYFALKRA